MGTEKSLEQAALGSTVDQFYAFLANIFICNITPTSDKSAAKLKRGIEHLEKDTLLVSQLGVFSNNETIEELSTSSIKFLLLPVLLGSLTLKRTDLERTEILRLANIYFRDFIERCGLYQITEIKLPKEDNYEDEESLETMKKPPKRGMPTPDELAKMAQQREEKLKRFKEKKSLGEKLINLKKDLDNPSHDEELLRKYHITMIKKFVCDRSGIKDHLCMEHQLLPKVGQWLRRKLFVGASSELVSETLPPILITRDALQKQVYGMGYPSLPVMSIEEFYDNRVKEGWFPDPNQKKDKIIQQNRANEGGEDERDAAEAEEVVKEEAEERDDPEKLAKDRGRDDWKDTHKTGWGNTYNRSR
ncbi:unnamed protein product, partial [Meganyctiphanes norvegica]